MSEGHLSPRILRQLFAGEASSQEVLKCLLHLHRVCPTCRQSVADFFGVPATEREATVNERGPGEAYEEAFAQRNHHAGRVAAQALFDELRGLPTGCRRIAVESTRRFHDWVLAEHLVSQTESPVAEAIVEEGWAELALVIADRLPPESHGALIIAELKARAWSSISTSRRVAGRLRSADEALQLAELYFREAMPTLVTEARLLESKARLRRAQRRFDEARALAERVLSIHRNQNDQEGIANALILCGTVLGEAGDAEGEIGCNEEALHYIDVEHDRLSVLCIQQNLVLGLTDAGRLGEAAEKLRQVHNLLADYGDEPRIRLRVLWSEGRLAAASGDEERAIELFLRARDGFLDEGQGYNAALVSLAMAALYLNRGEIGTVRHLAESMLPIFQAQDVHREAMAALMVFQRAALAEQATVRLIQRLEKYLRRARHDPEFRFRRPS